MKKVTVSVGDIVSINNYKNDRMSRPVVVEVIKPGGLMICRCLIRSSPAKPIYRSYYAKNIGSISRIKMD